MKKFIASLVLLCGLSLAVQAGTINITVTTAGAPCSGGCVKSYTDTDANLGKIITAYQVACNAKNNGPCTSVQVLSFWADQMVAATVQAVTSNDQQALQSAATSGYTPINPK